MKPLAGTAVEGAPTAEFPPPEADLHVDPHEETLWDCESGLWRKDPALFGEADGSYCEWLRQLMLRMGRSESSFDVRAPLLPRARRVKTAPWGQGLNSEPREMQLKHLTRQAFRRPMPALAALEYRALCERTDRGELGVYACTTTYMLHRQDWFVIQHSRLSVR